MEGPIPRPHWTRRPVKASRSVRDGGATCCVVSSPEGRPSTRVGCKSLLLTYSHTTSWSSSLSGARTYAHTFTLSHTRTVKVLLRGWWRRQHIFCSSCWGPFLVLLKVALSQSSQIIEPSAAPLSQPVSLSVFLGLGLTSPHRTRHSRRLDGELRFTVHIHTY